MDSFSTNDLYTTAILIACGFPMVEVDTNDDTGRKTFYFDNTEDLKKSLMAYRNGTLTGNLKNFKNAIENVKDIVHANY